jgi:DNA repair photolyase
LDLLKRISERSTIMVNLSITTVRTHLARLLEPRAPRPDLRLGAVRALREAGISAGVLAMPVLPWLTDSENDLDALAHAAADAGAQWFAARVLHLMPSSAKHFLPFVAEKFPRLVSQYRSWYGRAANAPEKYRQTISARVERARQKYDLGQRPPRGGHVRKSAQMHFTLGGASEPCHA